MSRDTLLGRRPLFVAVAFTVIGVLPPYLMGAQVVQLETALDFGAARLGWTMSCFFGSAALAARPVGRIIQHRGARTGLRFGAGLAAVAALVAAATPVWWILPVAAAIAGIANANMQVSTNLVLAREVRSGAQGVGFGAKQAAVPMASLLAGLALPVVGLTLGWRWPFLLAAVASAVLAWRAPDVAPVDLGDRPPSRRWRTPPDLVFLALAGACGGAAGNAIALFIVPSAVDVGISEASAGAVLAACSALVVVVRIAAGWSAGRTPGSTGHREIAILVAAGAVGCTALALADSRLAYLIAMPVAMTGSWGWPGVIYFTVARSHPGHTARASGVVLSANLTGTMTGPAVVGILAGRGAYPAAFALCGALSAVAAVAILRSKALLGRSAAVDRTRMEQT